MPCQVIGGGEQEFLVGETGEESTWQEPYQEESVTLLPSASGGEIIELNCVSDFFPSLSQITCQPNTPRRRNRRPVLKLVNCQSVPIVSSLEQPVTCPDMYMKVTKEKMNCLDVIG